MRVSIHFDSASTEQVRQLSVALHRATGDNTLNLGVNGPEAWHGSTPLLTPDQFTAVAAHVCKADGRTFAELIDQVRAAEVEQ